MGRIEQETDDMNRGFSLLEGSSGVFLSPWELRGRNTRVDFFQNLGNTRMSVSERINASCSVYGNMIHIPIDRDWCRGEVFLILSLPSQCGTERLKGILSVSC